MQRLLLIVLLIVTFKNVGFSQQDPLFTHYIFNQLYLNPATAGADNKTKVQAIYRQQYVGYTGTFDAGGAPVTQIVSASVPLKIVGGGVGIHFVNDQIGGGNTNRELQLSYAYQLPIGGSKLSFGGAAGIHQKNLNPASYRPRDPSDPAIPTTNVSQSALDFGVGVYLSNPAYSLGLSMKHLNQPEFGLGTTAKNTLQRSAYLTGSMLFGVSYDVDISPMFVLKSDMKNISPEAGFLTTYKSSYYLGASYRWQDAASALVGASFLSNSLHIAYAFDWVIEGVKGKSPSSHEVLVSYSFAPPRAGKKSIVRTPRYRF